MLFRSREIGERQHPQVTAEALGGHQTAHHEHLGLLGRWRGWRGGVVHLRTLSPPPERGGLGRSAPGGWPGPPRALGIQAIGACGFDNGAGFLLSGVPHGT